VSFANQLTVARTVAVPIVIVLFAWDFPHHDYLATAVFAVAMATDWLDGWWARRFDRGSAFGRSLDPLTDKVLIGAAFIFLIPVREAGIAPWMVAVVICRELLVTGLRGMVEATGRKFGADWFGKLKTILQCAWLVAVLLYLTVKDQPWASEIERPVKMMHLGLLYAMLAATILSGLQYCAKAVALLRAP
jgi:CDP-diacylglycerol--glycerol-3-phosphate 3-phosphatidyltransferase